MEKSDILRLFLEKGYQIDIETLNYFFKNEKSFKKFLEEIDNKSAPPTITKDFVDLTLESDIEITVHQTEKKIMAVEDLSKIIFSKYIIIKKILLTHLDLTNLLSVNKITEKTKKFSLIGIVSAIDEASKTLTIADDTGEIILKTDQKIFEDILLNDVLGFICEKNEQTYVKSIIFPDIPLRRTIKSLTEDVKAIFTEKISKNVVDFCANEPHLVYVFTFSPHEGEDMLPKNMKIIHISSNSPTSVVISKTFHIFLFNSDFLKKVMKERKPEEFLVSMLKRRYINATASFDCNFVNDAFIFENVPDVIVVKDLCEALQTNYKGTTILALDSNSFWVINLKTREIIKLSAH
jgi:DNA polymerase II small subunit/DNA polymerase delta subunit B